MNQHPLVTVFIPCYNQGHVIAKAITSVLNQDYYNLDVIIGDDASTDNTKEVVIPFLIDKRVRYERSSSNLGRVANYRRGIQELARGEWYINLDGDDYYDNKGYISAAISLATEKEECILVFGRQKYLDASTGKISIHSPPNVDRWTSGIQFLRHYVLLNEGIPHMSALYRVKIARKCNLFMNNIVFADAEAILRLLPWGMIGYCNAFSGVWVYHGNNDSHNLSIDLRLKNLTMITSTADFFVESNVFSQEEAHKWRDPWLKRLIRDGIHFYLDNLCYKMAFQFWKNAGHELNLYQRFDIWFHWRVIIRIFFPYFSKFKQFIKGLL